MEDVKKIFFLGIGGIGMSALARYFLHRGCNVYGYDREISEISDALSIAGATIFYEDDINLLPEDIDLVIYTPAIPKNSNLFVHLLEANVDMIKRSTALGMITKDKFTIAVAGSHGKTTVSAMIAYVLKECGIDCSAFLGGISANFGSNYVLGTEDIVVVEADEFDRSFMQLHPDLIVITSIDTDHLDIYGTQENIIKSFQEFVDKLDENGILVINEKAEQMIQTNCEKIVYGFDNDEYNAVDIQIFNNHSKFKINQDPQVYKMNFNGRHNIENALAAAVVSSLMDIDETEIAKALVGFKGIKRRFETLYQTEKTVYIDDYAHHPREIEACIGSIREIYPDRHITAIFQPHLYSRTQDLYKEFAHSLDLADQIYLLDIYPARELPIEGVTSHIIADQMTQPVEVISVSDMLNRISSQNVDILVTLGAGSISNHTSEIVNILKNKTL